MSTQSGTGAVTVAKNAERCSARGRKAVSGSQCIMTDYKELIRKYYRQVWNAWSDEALAELISPGIVFRGSIGTSLQGISEFRQYVNTIRSAFPDFHNHIEQLIGEGETVVARLTYTGTHRGELFGFPGTGSSISYGGMAIFQFRENKIVSGYVLGETESLKRQLRQAHISALARKFPGEMNISLASESEQFWAAQLMSRSEPWKSLGRTFENSLQALRSACYSLLIAHGADGKPRGFLLVHPEGVAGSPYIKSLGVDEAFRGGGIGSRLLRFADLLFERSSRHIFLCVSSFNTRARTLYERLGYEVVADFKGYVIPEASELLMYKSLHHANQQPQESTRAPRPRH